MNTPERKPISAIFYHDGKPHSVFSGDSEHYSMYDFDWCEVSNALAYHNSGSGPDGPYVGRLCDCEPPLEKVWIREGVQVCDASSRETRPLTDEDLASFGWERIENPLPLPAWSGTTPNPFDHKAATEGNAVYCSVCGSMILDDGTASPCDHLNWCGDCGDWSGAGSDDGDCEHGDEKKEGETK